MRILGFCTPHYSAETVVDLTPSYLRELGVRNLLLDVDCTLKRYRTNEVAGEVARWMAEMQEARIGLCLVSNGRRERIEAFAQKMGIPFIATALKPLPYACVTAARRMGWDLRYTAMVGDQLFTDIMAGRLAGLTAILVHPIHPEDEPWFTRLKRPVERFLLTLLKRTIRPVACANPNLAVPPVVEGDQKHGCAADDCPTPAPPGDERKGGG